MTKDGTMVIRPTGGAPLQGGEDIRNTSWVIVKAKVPIRAEHKLYEEALASARGYTPTTDVPRYKGYQVERMEIGEDGSEGQWQTLASVVPKTLVRSMETWPIQTPDLINLKYRHPLLTYPLPPMVLRSWDESVTHSELPIPTPEELMGGGGEDDDRGRNGRGRNGRGRDQGDNGDEGTGDLFQDATQRPQPGAPPAASAMRGDRGRAGAGLFLTAGSVMKGEGPHSAGSTAMVTKAAASRSA